MKPFTRLELLIIREICAANGKLFVYKLHNKKNLAPSFLNKAIRVLENRKIVNVDGLFLQLTERGKDVVLSSKSVPLASKDKPWRECPEKFKDVQMPINQPYVPTKKLF